MNPPRVMGMKVKIDGEPRCHIYLYYNHESQKIKVVKVVSKGLEKSILEENPLLKEGSEFEFGSYGDYGKKLGEIIERRIPKNIFGIPKYTVGIVPTEPTPYIARFLLGRGNKSYSTESGSK